MTGLLFAGLFAQAQAGSWKIKINNKTILSTSIENEKGNCKKITGAVWNKAGTLEIDFTEVNPDDWIRSFLFYDREDRELLRKDSTTHTTISFDELKKIYGETKEIIIYTVVAPADPTIAIRVRRVHLCTLRLP